MKWEYLLRDVPFQLFTDHRNLTFMNKSTSPKVKRWKMLVQEYDFKIAHAPGRNNQIADAFSRLIVNDPNNSVHVVAATYIDRIINNELMSVGSSPLVPNYEIIEKVHNEIAGHHGVDRTIDKLKILGHRWKQTFTICN